VTPAAVVEGESGGGLARAREGAHGEEKAAANLTGKSTGGERQRASGAADRGGGGRRRAAAALQGRGRGRVRGGTGRGKRGDAPPAKNRLGTHCERRIGGEEGARGGGVNGGGG